MEAPPSPVKPSSGDVGADATDYYQVLGVPRDATEKQINVAYKKLALKFHPDRNMDDPYAASKYKSVQDAHHTLADASRRKAYDSRGESPSVAPTPITEEEGVDVAGLGGLGRVFGAVMQRLGSIAIHTSVAADILETAASICKNGGIEGGGPPLDPRVTDLAWGWPAEGKADRQAGVFYRLTVDATHREAGFFLHAKSANKDKFKLLLFDKEGALLHSEDCHRSTTTSGAGKGTAGPTQASLFFTTFDTYSLPDQQPPAGGSGPQGAPSVLSRLEGLRPGAKALAEGQYLVCVYGDNFMSKASYALAALRANSHAPQVGAIEETDDQLVELKASLSNLKADYLKAKEAYEAVLDTVKTQGERVDALLVQREQLYSDFVEGCAVAFAPQTLDGVPLPPAGTSSGVLAQGVQKIATNVNAFFLQAMQAGTQQPQTAAVAAGDAETGSGTAEETAPVAPAPSLSSIAASATSNAQAAGGWIARRLSFSLPSMPSLGKHATPEEVEGQHTPSVASASSTAHHHAEEAAASAHHQQQHHQQQQAVEEPQAQHQAHGQHQGQGQGQAAGEAEADLEEVGGPATAV